LVLLALRSEKFRRLNMERKSSGNKRKVVAHQSTPPPM
jgi:hypothetical protein